MGSQNCLCWFFLDFVVYTGVFFQIGFVYLLEEIVDRQVGLRMNLVQSKKEAGRRKG